MGGARHSFKTNAQRANPVFSPSQVTAISGWLRLAASTAVSGEWPTVVDVLNPGSPMTQPSANRKAAVGASANGLPTMVFDATDVYSWPYSPAHSSTTKVGIWLRYKPSTVSGTQRLYGDSFANRLQFYATTSKLQCECYISGANGRFGATPTGALVAGAWHAIYLSYDSSRGGDGNLQIWVNGVNLTLTYGNLGVGGTLGALQAATGSTLVGGGTDTDTPANPIANLGEIGPNIYAENDNLTVAQELALRTFEAPT